MTRAALKLLIRAAATEDRTFPDQLERHGLRRRALLGFAIGKLPNLVEAIEEAEAALTVIAMLGEHASTTERVVARLALTRIRGFAP